MMGASHPLISPTDQASVARLGSTVVGDQEVVPFSQQSRSHRWVSSSLVAGVERDICCVNRSHHSPNWCPYLASQSVVPEWAGRAAVLMFSLFSWLRKVEGGW
jgi:hypothetical protein